MPTVVVATVVGAGGGVAWTVGAVGAGSGGGGGKVFGSVDEPCGGDVIVTVPELDGGLTLVGVRFAGRVDVDVVLVVDVELVVELMVAAGDAVVDGNMVGGDMVGGDACGDVALPDANVSAPATRPTDATAATA